MKILLSHGYFLNGDKVEQKVMKPYPPLGILYLSGFLQQNGISHQVFDSTFSSPEALQKEISLHKPEVIGLYVNFLTRKNILKLIAYVKMNEDLRDSRIVLGGPDVRYHADAYLDHGADFIVPGEGERTFHELVSALAANRTLDCVKGLMFRNGEGITVNTGERPHEKDLSFLPLPNRDSIDIEAYLDVWKKHHGYSSLTVSTQRGCPFSCNWCSHAVFGDTYRRRPAAEVVNEIGLLNAKYSPDSFWFVDDVFTMSENWIREFSLELKSQKLSIKYECITRADRLNREILAELKASGCDLVWIGAESGSQKVLDLMDRRVKAEQVRAMIAEAREIGIRTGTFIMLGYPGETHADIEETIRHLKKANPDHFTINLAYPIKGTRMHEAVEPFIDPGWNWETTPDRDIGFRRTYSSRYYDFAVRKVFNEVHAFRAMSGGPSKAWLKFKLKSLTAGALMQLYKNRIT